MSSRVALLVPACIAMIIGSPAAAADVPLPTGSYLATCKVVSFDSATGDLVANCEGPAVGMFGHGTPDTSNFNVTGCREGTIWNDQRQLYCLAATAWGSERVIPPGSYIETCTDRKIVGGGLLTAVCDNGNGVARNASIDLRPCKWGADIWNSGGTLACDSSLIASAIKNGRIADSAKEPQPGIAKPVAIEPGLVKPVTIAPLAPIPGGPTEGKDGKKKKDKGERG